MNELKDKIDVILNAGWSPLAQLSVLAELLDERIKLIPEFSSDHDDVGYYYEVIDDLRVLAEKLHCHTSVVISQEFEEFFNEESGDDLEDANEIAPIGAIPDDLFSRNQENNGKQRLGLREVTP